MFGQIGNAFGGPMEMVPVNGNPQRCALVDLNTKKVVNLIVADPVANLHPEGTIIVGLTNDSQVSFDWIYNDDGTFTNPNPETN